MNKVWKNGVVSKFFSPRFSASYMTVLVCAACATVATLNSNSGDVTPNCPIKRQNLLVIALLYLCYWPQSHFPTFLNRWIFPPFIKPCFIFFPSVCVFLKSSGVMGKLYMWPDNVFTLSHQTLRHDMNGKSQPFFQCFRSHFCKLLITWGIKGYRSHDIYRNIFLV